MGATNPQQKLQFTSTFFNGPNPTSGYDTENGNATISLSQYFGANTNANSASLTINATKLQSIILLSDKGCTLSLSTAGNWNGTGSAEVQSISISGGPNAGTFPIYFNGAMVSGIPYNANAATVQSNLNGIAALNGNITCSGGPLPGSAVNCTFGGPLNTGQQPLMISAAGGLTGGTNTAITISRATAGQPTQTITLIAGIPIVWGTSQNTTCPINSNVNSAYVSNNAAQNLQVAGLTL